MPELKPKAFPGHSAVQLVEVAVGECAIHSVVVYQDRAEVKRSLPVHLLAGENELILTNMAECADKNSVRYVAASDPCTDTDTHTHTRMHAHTHARTHTHLHTQT